MRIRGRRSIIRSGEVDFRIRAWGKRLLEGCITYSAYLHRSQGLKGAWRFHYVDQASQSPLSLPAMAHSLYLSLEGLSIKHSARL